MKPWSKLKSRIESLWSDDLAMSVHCTSYPYNSPGSPIRVSRHWITLDKIILWDFPGPFLSVDRKRGGHVQNAEPHFANGGSIIGELICEYLDRPRDQLVLPFAADLWEFTDILRAADRRMGRATLEVWVSGLDDEHPARQVFASRYATSAQP
jgi:hypothetical protein